MSRAVYQNSLHNVLYEFWRKSGHVFTGALYIVSSLQLKFWSTSAVGKSTFPRLEEENMEAGEQFKDNRY